MAENPRDLAPHFFLRPVRVLRTEPRRFHFARRPAKLFRQREAAFGRHPAVNRELLRAGLFIRQHEKRMRQKNGSRKCASDAVTATEIVFGILDLEEFLKEQIHWVNKDFFRDVQAR
jgi:hypothetical protein